MQPEDMIIVSVDDHVDRAGATCSTATCRPSTPTRRPVWRATPRAAAVGVPGRAMSTITAVNAVVGWPKEEWGFDPTTLRRDAARHLRRRRARARHEPQRHPGLDVLPELPGLRGRRLPGGRGQGPVLVMLQAYNDWHIDEWCAVAPRPVHPPGHPAGVGHGRRWWPRCTGCRPRAARRSRMPELPHIQGLPSYHSDYWVPVLPGLRATRTSWCACTSARASTPSSMALTRRGQPDDPGHPGVGARRPGPAVGPRPAQVPRPARSRGPRVASAGSPSTSTAATATTQPAVDRQDFGGKLPSEVFREHSLACYITDPSALRLHDASAWTTSPSRPTTRTRTRLWPDAPECCLPELVAAGCTDEEIDKISWKNACGVLPARTPSSTSRKVEATVGALRALGPGRRRVHRVT